MMPAIRKLLGRYGVIAWRRRWAAIAVVWVICLAGWAAVASLPNQYKSSARLYVDTGAILTPLLKGLAVDGSTGNDVDVLQRTLLSRPNLEKLISKTDLDQRAPTGTAREHLIQTLATSIHISPQTTNLFTIEYTDRSAKMARDVVLTIVNLFVEDATGNTRDDIDSARTFLERQIAKYETQLREAEQARASFQIKYADLLPGATGGASRLDAARDQAAQLKGQVIDATARRNLLKQEMAATPPLLVTEIDGGGTMIGGGVSGGGSSRLQDAERNLQQLRLQFTDRYPDVVAAQALVNSLKATGGGDTGRSTGAAGGAPPHGRSVPNPVFEQLKVRLIDAESTLASLQRQADEATRDADRLAAIMRSVPQVQAQAVNLNRDYDVLRKNYDELLARRESIRIGAAADDETDKIKLRIVDAPQIPALPVGPKRTLLTIGVLIAGLGAGVGVIFLALQMDTAFYSIQDLRRIGLPVLGGISLQERRKSPRRYTSILGFAVCVALLLVVFGGFATYPSWLSKFV